MNIIFFITHATLTLDHAVETFASISRSINPMIFDMLWIYNTHQHELDSIEIIRLYNVYSLSNIIKDIRYFPDTYPDQKKLTHDINTIKNFCNKMYSQSDRFLILKSDIILSTNLLNDLTKMGAISSFVLSPPFVVAKKRVHIDDIVQYSKRPFFIPSDNETFFNENEDGSNDNDHRNRPNIKPTDSSIKFISCTVKSDFSCHYLTLDCLNNLVIHIDNTWGGVNFSRLKDRWFGTNRGFTIHQYHDIVSNNRPAPREGSIELYMLS
jgi:hypothetical protein